MLSNSHEAFIPLQATTTFLYKPHNWLAKINFINHLVLFNDLIIVVMAERGGGKTSFVHLLQENLDLEINVNLIDAKTPLAEAQILTELEKFCKQPKCIKPQLSELVKEVNTIKKHILIIIDNAHCLKEDFLKSLLEEVRKYQHNFFHICLATDFSLNPLLNSLHSDSYKDLIHTIELGPLSKKETRKYLLKKLPVSRGISKNLTDKCLNEFYNLTSGQIAQINAHLDAFFKLNKTNQLPLLKSINFMGGLFFLALLIAYVGKIKFKTYETSASQFSNSFKPILVAENQNIIQEPLVQNNQVTISTKKSIDQALEQFFINEEVSSAYVNHLHFINEEVSKIAQAVLIEESELSFLKSNLQPINNFFETKLAPNTMPENSYFTIQLGAGPDKEKLKHFLLKHMISDAQINHVKLNGKDWFIVTLGQYSQVKQAKMALNHLNPKLLKLKPWVRKLPSTSLS
ncbi:DamX-like protein [Legionella busanensis]|uniref:DamX-like protein n=1 Tax=Legionella busanensis TaxID=190655 RepID=A0A378JHE5_9GAMM|nr:AAA family ATPase [Legionella busanensis]STX50726.1 DamX-like protein [Legionella busanensis]